MKKVKTGGELRKALLEVKALTGEKYITVISKLSMDGFNQLVARSARQTGYLRSNWAVTNSDSYALNSRQGATGGSYADASYPSGLKPTIDGVISLYNNTSYAMYLEEGTPHMRAQPMIHPVYMYLETEAKNLAAKLSQERLNV